MSADLLREAAALMRERAEAAPSPPWSARPTTHGDPANGPTHMVVENNRGLISDHDYDRWGGTSAEHIASWHPAVALEVAPFLEFAAPYGNQPEPQSPTVQFAVSIARAYLGQDA